ncbi:MAG: hypothetical protein PHV02_08715 [Rhodocyclaceae bacterium]|nr:hypothetical protein [Rhodocyclaceae bacterium]
MKNDTADTSASLFKIGAMSMGHSFHANRCVETRFYATGMTRPVVSPRASRPFYPAGLVAGRAFFRRFHEALLLCWGVAMVRESESFVY